MINHFYEHLQNVSPVSVVVITVALMLFCGFFATRLTQLLRLPNVTAYILSGVVLGPFCMGLIPTSVSKGLDFIPDIALAFIAFSAGEYFRITTLRENGKRVILITIFESLGASLFVFILTFFILHLGMAFSVILAALASATAPASTLMTIRQTGAKGDFVNTLLTVVALDDVVSLLAYSVAVAVAIACETGRFSPDVICRPILLNLLMIVAGALLGVVLKSLMFGRSTDNRLIVSVALLFAICGLGAALDISPLLGCMTLGMVYINITDDEKLFRQLNYFSPPILLLFFVKSGADFRVDTLCNTKSALCGVPLLMIGIAYFVVRILGKYAGAYLGCAAVRKRAPIRNFLGLALIPQAGVAIGLAALGARLLGGESGSALQTIILSSSILYEIIGPGCAKLALYLSSSFGSQTAEPNTNGQNTYSGNPLQKQETVQDEMEQLKTKLLELQHKIRNQEYSRSADELAFNEVSEKPGDDEEGVIFDYLTRNNKFRNKR